MNRFVQIGQISAIATIAFSTISCSTTEISQQPLVAETELSTPSQPSPEPTPQNVSQTLAEVSGLTPSTNPEERLAQLQEGQRDPFSPLQTAPIVIPQSVKSQPSIPSIPEVNITVKPNSAPQPVRPLPVLPVPALTPPPPPVPQLPALQPNPSLQPIPGTIEVAQTQPIPVPVPVKPLSGAEQVKVTGVIELLDGMRAIVKAPDEPTSRYVVPGESLSNGKIRVKRIAMSSSGSPIVVLEENGKEFVKTVSDRP